ncbi:MAG: DeoR/GlpR family DNA-binding transcription regulator [Bariatricus sp.]|nr:DeoR/GlpR family DNA-binding transcription regulator [Bariatricus sp.]
MMQERRNVILQELNEYGKVKVADLSKKLECSEVTIRNDIKSMDKEGLLKRTHGGAIRLEDKVQRKYSAESIYRNTERKRQIAACAYEYIEDRDTIIIDDASNSFYLALYIKEHPEKRIAVVTNSLLVGNELAGVRHVELYLIGGHVGGHLAATMGESALQNMEQFHVDKGFIGVHSINFDVGLTSIATPQMQVKRAILKSASQVYVLADSSKFGGGYVSVICPVKDVYKIITDSQIGKEYIRKAEKEQIPLVVASAKYEI